MHPEAVAMTEQSNDRRDAEDPMARMSGAVAEDYQAVDTDRDGAATARSRTEDGAGPEADPRENLQVEPPA